jgi:hypothetical protein
MRIRSFSVLAALVIAPLAPLAAKADNISWTNWDPNSFVQTCPPTPGYPLPCQGGNQYYPAIATGTAVGLNGQPITVTMFGQFDSVTNVPNWLPTGTYAGGSVGDAPPQGNNSIKMIGGFSAAGNVYYQDIITFSSPVVNPAFAIWSLGSANNPATFVFDAGQPFSIVAGGAGQQYGGQSITQGTGANSETVYGIEGNGTIRFQGTYSQLTFTAPISENYFAFTVGASTPEPSSLALLGTGLLGVVGVARKKMFKA